MSRTVKDKRPNVKPVEKVELSNKNMKRQVIIAALLLGIGILLVGISLQRLLSTEDGWEEVEVTNKNVAHCGDDFVFLYEFGKSDISATAENKALSTAYSNAIIKAYQMFDSAAVSDEIININYINNHPNEKIKVDKALYNAFEIVVENKSTNIYMGPVYETYDDLFSCQDDSKVLDFDPYSNKDIEKYYKKIIEYIKNGAVNIELLDDNNVRLNISKDYHEFAKEQGICNFIDFNVTLNAFIIDYVADELIKDGFVNGCITSYDGFSRNLSDNKDSRSFNIFGELAGKKRQVASFNYSGLKSIVCFRNFPINDSEGKNYYTFDDGKIYSKYLDTDDGFNKTATDTLIGYSDKEKCSDIALKLLDIYAKEELNQDKLNALEKKQIFAIYSMGENIFYNESKADIEIFEFEDGKYTCSEIK